MFSCFSIREYSTSDTAHSLLDIQCLRQAFVFTVERSHLFTNKCTLSFSSDFIKKKKRHTVSSKILRQLHKKNDFDD